jgi:endonuclease V-like protein UPF0215 family
MIRPIGAVKKEIRILGLDTCNHRLTVGTVVRGGLYLDGVASFPAYRNDVSRRVAKRITEWAYFPELRAIMLHDPTDQLDSTALEGLTELPTMVISKDELNHSRGYQRFQGDLGRLWVKTRLEPSSLKKILSVSWTIDKLPEPLRVAHLLARLKVQNGTLMR